MVLSLFALVSTNGFATKVKVTKPLTILPYTKLTLLLDNKLQPISIAELGKIESSYCLIENYKMVMLNINPPANFNFTGKRTPFLNHNIRRFEIFDDSNLSIYCDGTLGGDTLDARGLLEKHGNDFFELVD